MNDPVEKIFEDAAKMKSPIVGHETVEDYFNSPEYAAFVESMAQHCHCESPHPRPCDGVLAGGICDGLRDDRFERDEDFEEDDSL